MACFQDGLRRQPTIGGRVVTRFIIDRSGAVAEAQITESALKDSRVEACVSRAFRSLSFPQPEGGVVHVVYPFVFDNMED